MSWLSKNLKKAGKWGQRRGRQIFTRPSAWKKWKPGRQRGLGLGKFITGLAQIATPQDNKEMHDKLDYMGNVDSLWKGVGRFFEDDYKRLGEWEDFESSGTYQDFEDQYGDDFSDFSDDQIMELFDSDDQDQIRFALSKLGYDDLDGDLSSVVMDKLPNIKRLHDKKMREGLAPITGEWDKYSAQTGSLKRGQGGFGKFMDDTMLMKLMAGLEDKYGDLKTGTKANLVNQILQSIEGQDT